MNICTISNDAWLHSHCARWIRYARLSNPSAKFFLHYCGERDLSDPVLGQFDVVKQYGIECDRRDWYNQIRMRAVSDFCVDEILYCDADADILRDLSDVPKFSDKKLMWVKSPSVTDEWKALCEKNKWESWGANNGFLYLRKDWDDDYDYWLEWAKKNSTTQRILGTYAFNAMIRADTDNCELPYENSVIWWDWGSHAYLEAKTIQWCNDRGQAKRLQLEQSWRDALS